MTKNITIDKDSAYEAYLIYISKLSNNIIGFHNSTRHLNGIYNIKHLQNIIFNIKGLGDIREHKAIKKNVLATIKLLDKIMEV